MEFTIEIQENINTIMRKIGYQPAYFQKPGETSIVRQITRADYPRFHLYIKNSGADFTFNLHLDQKKPSYEGSHAHSGDYDGPVVEGEAERIRSLLEV